MKVAPLEWLPARMLSCSGEDSAGWVRSIDVLDMLHHSLAARRLVERLGGTRGVIVCLSGVQQRRRQFFLGVFCRKKTSLRFEGISG